MSNKKSQFLKAFGKAFQVFKSITDAVLDAGGDDEDINRILADEKLRHEIAQQIIKSKHRPSRSTPKLDAALKDLEDKREAKERPRREKALQDENELEQSTEELFVFCQTEEANKIDRLLDFSEKKILNRQHNVNSGIYTFMGTLRFANKSHDECRSLLEWWMNHHYRSPKEFVSTIREQSTLIAELHLETKE